MRRLLPLAAVITFVAAFEVSGLVLPTPSVIAGDDPDPLMKRLSDRTTQGWRDDSLPVPELERRFEQGERLYVTCGTVSRLAQRLLAAEGIESRVVTTLTRQAFNRSDDGHTMIEARTREGWVLFDIGTNRVAVDPSGNRIGFLEQIHAGRDRHWKLLANDRLIDFRGLQAEPDLYLRDLRLWYQRVLGTPMIETAPGSGEYAFHDSPQRERVESYSPSYRWASEPEWSRLTTG